MWAPQAKHSYILQLARPFREHNGLNSCFFYKAFWSKSCSEGHTNLIGNESNDCNDSDNEVLKQAMFIAWHHFVGKG